MENIILWVGMAVILLTVIFLALSKYIILGVFVLLSGGIIFALEKFEFISGTTSSFLLGGLIVLIAGFIIHSFIKLKKSIIPPEKTEETKKESKNANN
jgi:predicted membrane channel-forming protein YqfA (hemolysin III family)